MPLVLALLSSVFWGSADFFGGTLTRRLPAMFVVGISQLVGGFCIVGAAMALGEFGGPLDYLPWAIAAGLVGALALVAFYAALATGTMGVVAPIAALGAVVPVLAGLGEGERPESRQIVGIVMAVLGVVLASRPEISGASGRRPVVLAALSAVGFGFALLFLAKGSETSYWMTAAGMRAASVPLMALLLVTVVRAGREHFSRRDLPLIALIGIADAAANVAFGAATTSELVSIVAVLGSLYPVVTVGLARILHGERLARIQQVGVTLALVGVALIASG